MMSWERQITIKSKRELDVMRTAGKINAEALQAVADLAQPGITTAELNAAAESVLKKSSSVAVCLFPGGDSISLPIK